MKSNLDIIAHLQQTERTLKLCLKGGCSKYAEAIYKRELALVQRILRWITED